MARPASYIYIKESYGGIKWTEDQPKERTHLVPSCHFAALCLPGDTPINPGDTRRRERSAPSGRFNFFSAKTCRMMTRLLPAPPPSGRHASCVGTLAALSFQVRALGLTRLLSTTTSSRSTTFSADTRPRIICINLAQIPCERKKSGDSRISRSRVFWRSPQGENAPSYSVTRALQMKLTWPWCQGFLGRVS